MLKGRALKMCITGGKSKEGSGLNTKRRRKGSSESLGVRDGVSQNQREAGKEDGGTGEGTLRNWSPPSRVRTDPVSCSYNLEQVWPPPGQWGWHYGVMHRLRRQPSASLLGF